MAKNKLKPGNIIWFEVPADKPERAKKFYKSLFGWKINEIPGMGGYQHINTGGPDDSPDGGLMKRACPEQQGIMTYILVPSVTKAMAKVKKLGGKVCMEKTEVPGMGCFAVCLDTEKNAFAVWEIKMKAK